MNVEEITPAIIHKWYEMSQSNKEKVIEMTEKSLLLFIIDQLETIEKKIDAMNKTID